MSHITGIGGVFVKSKDAATLKKWYQDKLGIALDDYGASFRFREHDNPENEGYSIWGVFKDDTDYFKPGVQPFMINFRVRDLDGLLKKLKAAGVEQAGKVEDHDYGRFAWVVDPNGTKIELWEQKGPAPKPAEVP
jgi:predicted enzyme related to lactoylglutathione lyase